MSMPEAIREKLEAAFDVESIDLEDRSDQHRGHAGWRPGGETHFHLTLVSIAFEGKSRLERQRLVHKALSAELAGPIHALSMELSAPGEGDGA
ncbi:MAG: BolA family protein [Sphingomonadales bacterium]